MGNGSTPSAGRWSVNAPALLANLPLFRDVQPEERAELATATRTQRLGGGEILFRRGDPCTGLYMVVHGRIQLSLATPHGAEKVLALFGAGESFGEAVLFLGKPYYVTAQACTDTLVLHVARDALLGLLDRDPRFARRMLAGLSARLHRLVGDVESYSLRSGTERVIGFLLRDPPPADGPRGLTVSLPVKKGVLASRLNLTQEHFSRILRDLIEAELITVRGRDITILDVERLRRHGTPDAD